MIAPPRRRRRAWTARAALLVLVAVLAAPAMAAPGDPPTVAPLPSDPVTAAPVTITGTWDDSEGAAPLVVELRRAERAPIALEPATEGGTWSATLDALPPDGTYDVVATQGELASAPAALRVDAPLTVTAPSGTVRTATVDLAGTGAEAGVPIAVAVDGVPVEGATIAGDGTWSATATGLAEGTHTATVTQGDDTAFGEFAVDLPVPLTIAAPTGTDSRPTFTGTAEPGRRVTVEIRRGDALARTLGPVPVEDDGDWTARPGEPLADGDYTAVAKRGAETARQGFTVAAPLTMDEPADPMLAPRPTFSGAGANPDPALPLTVTLGQKLLSMLPRRRVGRPEDLDGLLLLLAADESQFINGAVIAADDGFGLA